MMAKKARIEFETIGLTVYPHDAKIKANHCPKKPPTVKMVRVFKSTLEQIGRQAAEEGWRLCWEDCPIDCPIKTAAIKQAAH